MDREAQSDPATADSRVTQLELAVAENPGCDEFVELAGLLMEASRAQAREICFRGLAANPANRLGRLALARAFYLDGMFEFSIRELVELRRLMGSPAPSLDKLIGSFGPLAAQYELKPAPSEGARQSAAAPAGEASDAKPETEDAVVAELDLDTDFLEVLGDIEDDS